MKRRAAVAALAAALAFARCAAAPKTLAFVAATNGAPETLFEYVENITPEDVPVFAAAAKWSANAEKRRALWNDYLALMELEEYVPSHLPAYFKLTVGGRSYMFADTGRLFLDDRFVVDEELSAAESLERLLAGMLSRSARAKDFPLRDPESGREISAPGGTTVPVPVFSGYEDGFFQRHDAAVAALTEDFSTNAVLSASQYRLSAALLKSFLLEDFFNEWDGLSPDKAREAAGRLVEAGMKDGRFAGWNAALSRYSGVSVRDGDGRSFRNEFSARVILRARDPGRFVPVTWRTGQARHNQKENP